MMDINLNKQVGARIRAQREFLNLTREGLCNYVSISPQFLSEIERGIKGVSAETLYKLCEGLSVSADYILMGKNPTGESSDIFRTLAALDKKYLPIAEELLKTLVKAIAMKQM